MYLFWSFWGRIIGKDSKKRKDSNWNHGTHNLTQIEAKDTYLFGKSSNGYGTIPYTIVYKKIT